MAMDTVDCTLHTNKKRAQDAVKKLDKMDDPRHTGGLEKSVNVCIGVRVMLRQNLDTRRGLVNGVIGTITGFDKAPDDEVTRVRVKFDNHDNETSIERVRRKVQLFPGAYLHREMFPICLSYAMTIHKSQGLTLKCVLADLGRKIFVASQSYVALSRVTDLKGLHLINFEPKKIIANKLALIEYKRLGSKSSVEESNTSKGVTFMRHAERIWYTTATHQKAIEAVDGVLEDDAVRIEKTLKNEIASKREHHSKGTKVSLRKKIHHQQKPFHVNTNFPRIL